MARLKVYYAHPISLFGTPTQKRDMELLEALGLEIINPDDEEKQAGYESNGIEYFKEVVARADVVAFRAFPDGTIGAGVVMEITEYTEGKPVIEIPTGINKRALTVDQTRETLREIGHR